MSRTFTRSKWEVIHSHQKLLDVCDNSCVSFLNGPFGRDERPFLHGYRAGAGTDHPRYLEILNCIAQVEKRSDNLNRLFVALGSERMRRRRCKFGGFQQRRRRPLRRGQCGVISLIYLQQSTIMGACFVIMRSSTSKNMKSVILPNSGIAEVFCFLFIQRRASVSVCSTSWEKAKSSSIGVVAQRQDDSGDPSCSIRLPFPPDGRRLAWGGHPRRAPQHVFRKARDGYLLPYIALHSDFGHLDTLWPG